MVFCRGCSKEIHETAPSCPQCGALQTVVTKSNEESGWMGIVSAIFASLAFLGSVGVEGAHDRDAILGVSILGLGSLILGAISLHQRKPLKTLTIVAITFAALGLLILFGNSQSN